MNIFITGGSSGIGLSLAEAYARRGHRVGVCGRSREKFEEHVSSDVKEQVFFYSANVQDKETLGQVIHQFLEGRPLDLLIANAGIGVGKKSIDPDFDKLRTVIDVNLVGVINTFEIGYRLMKARGKGHLVAISSVAGLNGLPGASAYSASKAGVMKLCESFSIDFRKFGIDVTCICPGFIKTPLTDKNPHSMPFLMSVEKAIHLIMRAIDKKRVQYSFPLRMFWVVLFLSILPRKTYTTLMRLNEINYSVKD